MPQVAVCLYCCSPEAPHRKHTQAHSPGVPAAADTGVSASVSVSAALQILWIRLLAVVDARCCLKHATEQVAGPQGAAAGSEQKDDVLPFEPRAAWCLRDSMIAVLWFGITRSAAQMCERLKCGCGGWVAVGHTSARAGPRVQSNTLTVGCI
jgi:hypothetical protein